MAQSLTSLFGANASVSSGVLSITLADFTELDGSSPTATQIAAAILQYWATSTTSLTDDNTAGVVASSFQPSKTFVTRNNVSQIEQGFTINTYRADTTTSFDPDDVI
jgi:hypothetical protein